MAIRVYRPTTNARRHSSVDNFRNLGVTQPVKSLLITRKETGGRNNQGRITIRHRGAGVKRFIRIVDFKQNKFDIPATVEGIQYDPNRGARLALLKYKDGERRYIIAAAGIAVGDTILASKQEIPVKVGNRMPLSLIPVGTEVHNIELFPERGGELVRSAGLSAKLAGVEGPYAQLELPSKEVRLVFKNCMATIGAVGNSDYRLVRWGKAGRTRLRGIRPTVRGKVMNPVDHPHGGGEGRNSIGLKYPKTPWGKHALGVKTRKRKASDKFILVRRQARKRK